MNKNKLEQLVDKRQSTRKIAKYFGCSQYNVRYWLTKYGLRTNPPGRNRYAKATFTCQCGETDPEKFYGKRTSICAKCHNQYTLKKAKEKRKEVLRIMGGKCVKCGYFEFPCSSDIHHIDSTKKDPNFSSWQGWSMDRIRKEIKGCILLCRNCHHAFHSGELKLF